MADKVTPGIRLNILSDTNTDKSKVITVKKVEPVVYNSDSEDDTDQLSHEEDDESSDEEEDGFYVELNLTCTNDEEEYNDHTVVFNFGSESKYMDHAENGFEDLDGVFDEAININFPLWTYANEWDEAAVYGSDLPDDDELVVIDI